jgi:DNA-binding IclR family transcriptional regulator
MGPAAGVGTAGIEGVPMEPRFEGVGEGPGGGRPDDFVQSVGRAVRVLEVVGRYPGLPVKAIARHCDLNVSTSYHLVRTLAYEGYLVRLGNGTYVIGDTVARRFHDLVTSLARPPESAVVLRQLSDRVGLSSYLGLLHDGRVTVVEVAEASGSPYLEDFEVGLDVSAHATALGKALLVAMSPRERHTFLKGHELRPFTTRTRTDPEQLEAELGAVSPGASVTEHGEFRDGVSCAASLVPRLGRGDPAWAVVVAIGDEEVPARIANEVGLAAADLAGGAAST